MARVYTRDASPYFYGDYTIEGRRVRFRTDHQTRGAAQAQADEIERLEIARLKQKPGLTLAEAADRFFEQKTDLKPNTVTNYEYALSALLRIKGDFVLADLGTEDIKSYILERQKTAGTTTVRADFRFLSSLYSFAQHEDKRITSNPVKAYDKKGITTANKRANWLTEAQVVILLEACRSDLHRCLVTLAVDTGMRKSELLKLHRNEIDFHLGVITLGNLSSSRTKTGKGRQIPLTTRARESLVKMIEAHKLAHRPRTNQPWSGFVFENPSTGSPITTVKTFWGAVCRRAGFNDLHFHDLRHTFATRGLHLGCDETSLMAITGHVSGDSFRRYSHASSESVKSVIDRMNLAQERHTTT